MKKIFPCFLILFIFGCKDRQSSTENRKSVSALKYAKGFWVEDHQTYKDVFVSQSGDSAQPVFHYRLINTGQSQNLTDDADIININVPISSIVCTSTTHIPLLDYLDETDRLVGFPNREYISSEKMRARIDRGLVTELGVEGNLNIELLMQLNPGVTMSYTMGNDLGSLKKVQELGIPVVINAEFLEQHPLGRAEWIKFMALFFGKEGMADSIFNWIENEYIKLQQSAQNMDTRPTILTGIPYGGTWFLPGGQNYGAQFFQDAGCQYLWRDDPTTGFLKLSLETVFSRALNADYWIGVGSFETYADLKSADDRFAKFSAFQNHTVYNYNNRIGATGGNEYLELGYLRPDLVLNDLIQVTHPKEHPTPSLFFYKPLK